MSSPESRPQRRDARLNRAAIIEAAARVLQTDPGAGLDRIALEAGLTRRAIYGHFESRDELIEEMLTAGAIRISASLFPLDDSDARIAIATIGSRLWGEVAHVRTTAQLAVRGPYRLRIAEVLRPLRDVLERMIRAGIRAGHFRQDVEPAVLARLVEAAALAVLDEATRGGLTAEEGNRLVIISALSCAGLGWEEAATYVDKVQPPDNRVQPGDTVRP